jgi:2-dehydro-3-deoxyglucarate aldolase/4-hydroxy-2-oxoheptanedioate aldolase
MFACEGLLRKRVDNRELLVFSNITESKSTSTVEVLQDAGFDGIFIDREHTALNTETIADQIRIARCLHFPCMVRVCDDSYHELNRTLDQAPDGIYIPRIRSREQVEKIMRTVKYAPEGIRGLAGYTCPVGKYHGWDNVKEQIETVNRNLVVGIQIETAEALENLDEILSVKGVDMAIVGPDDLSISMGIPGEWTSRTFLDAVQKVLDACQRHNVMPGIAGGDPEVAAKWVEKGMRVLWYANELCLMWMAGVQQINRLKDALKNVKY